MCPDKREARTIEIMLTVDDVADLLHTTPAEVYTMNCRRGLPNPARVGKRLLWFRDDLLGWLAESRAVARKGNTA
jgi:hypothetical protein